MNIKNAIVLVDQIDTETAAGKAPREAVISATTTRIVPVAMASGTTILGMLPLLFDAMFGGMAATIMGGLLVSFDTHPVCIARGLLCDTPDKG